jgi:hypothetical protein
MPSAVSQYQVTSPSLPSISSPLPPSESQYQVKPTSLALIPSPLSPSDLQYQVKSPSLPSISSPLLSSDSQLESQLPRDLDVVKIPHPLTDTLRMDEKDDSIEARFAKLEELMNQRRVNEPANSTEANDIQSAVIQHSDKESKDSLENDIHSRFEKEVKAQQEKEIQNSNHLIDLERVMMKTKREAQVPIKFKDAVGRKFILPFHIVCTWAVSYLILQLENLTKLTFCS